MFMRFLKPVLIGVLLLLVVLIVYLLLVKKEPVRAQIPFINKTISVSPSDLGTLGETTASQLTTLTEQSTSVSQQVEKVLGAAVQPAEGDPPAYDRALTYGQYLYCKQIVRDYETANPTSPN